MERPSKNFPEWIILKCSVYQCIVVLSYILSCIQIHREKIDRLVYGNTMYRTYIET